MSNVVKFQHISSFQLYNSIYMVPDKWITLFIFFVIFPFFFFKQIFVKGRFLEFRMYNNFANLFSKLSEVLFTKK